MISDKFHGAEKGPSPFNSVFYGKGLAVLKVACVVITLFPALWCALYMAEGELLLNSLVMLPVATLIALLSAMLVRHFEGEKIMTVLSCVVITLFPTLWCALYMVEGKSLLHSLVVLLVATLTALSSAILVRHFEGEKTMADLYNTARLRFRFLFPLVMLCIMFLSESTINRMFDESNLALLGLPDAGAHFLAVQSKLLWFVGVLLSLWVLINASYGGESVHQFKDSLADHDVNLRGDSAGTYALEVTFKGSVKPHDLTLDCDVPAYYSGVVVLFIVFSMLAQCVSITVNEPLVTAVFGFLSVVLIALLRDLDILRSQRIVYEYVASEQNKLSDNQRKSTSQRQGANQVCEVKNDVLA